MVERLFQKVLVGNDDRIRSEYYTVRVSRKDRECLLASEPLRILQWHLIR